MKMEAAGYSKTLLNIYQDLQNNFCALATDSCKNSIVRLAMCFCLHVKIYSHEMSYYFSIFKVEAHSFCKFHGMWRDGTKSSWYFRNWLVCCTGPRWQLSVVHLVESDLAGETEAFRGNQPQLNLESNLSHESGKLATGTAVNRHFTSEPACVYLCMNSTYS
jgi:hypothetical protein